MPNTNIRFVGGPLCGKTGDYERGEHDPRIPVLPVFIRAMPWRDRHHRYELEGLSPTGDVYVWKGVCLNDPYQQLPILPLVV